ncbi:uncharacterized protein LOC130425256 [Triplophysa dalaica]|uniref:uncharacterized protein LOC130425256 n=1 Tax=Triplophysa dalaica TaxID=1582913 RepID=UPI0024E0099F|nr:uncharacterized protein LOC130425256 [Triplophysa dalaica]
MAKTQQSRLGKVFYELFCLPVILDCHCEECEPRDILSVSTESEVFVTAQTSLISLMADNNQDNVEIVPRKKGKWKKRLKVVKDFFCEPLILDCSCEECKLKESTEIKSKSIDEESEVYVTAQTSLISLVEDKTQDTEEVFFDCLSELCSPEASPELDSQSIDEESEVYVTAQTTLISLFEVNATQDNVEIVPRKKGKWKKRLKVVKDFFCEPVILDCSCEECKLKESTEIKSKSIDEESEVYVTVQTSLTSLVEDNTQDTEEVFFDCLSELCSPEASPELYSQSIDEESEVYVTAQTTLISLVEVNATQDNVEIVPRKKGKWKKRLKVVKDFFCEPLILDCSCEECKLKESSEIKSKSIDEESEVYVTAQTSLTSLVEDNTQDTEEVFFDCLSELCSPEASPELYSQSIDEESEVYVTAQTTLISLVEVNATQDNVEIVPRKKGKWKKRLKVVKDFFCEPVILDCSCEECKLKESTEIKSKSIDEESEVYVTVQTSLTSLVEDNTQDTEE